MLTENLLHLKFTPSQSRILDTTATEIWFGGAAGGGKSAGLRRLAILAATEVPNLQVFLFRRKRPDLIRTHLRGGDRLQVIAKSLIDASLVKFVRDEVRFWNGSVIHLCHCNHEKDVENYLSAEFHLLLVDEASGFTPEMLKMLRSRCRISKELLAEAPEHWKARLPLMLYASNPGGLCHDYLKEQFYDPFPGGNVVFKAPRDDGGKQRVFLPSLVDDNPFLDSEEYKATLEGLGSEELVRMYRDGDMNVVLGAYFKEFGRDHIIRPFKIPDYWYRFRAMDWGYDHPHCCLWFAVSDGSVEGLDEGALVVYREQVEREMVAKDAGKSIANLSVSESIRYTVLDPAAFNKRNDIVKGRTVGDDLASVGVPCLPADNQRVLGWNQLHTRLRHNLLYIFDTCPALIKSIPKAQHAKNDAEDVMKFNGDDPLDTLRYGCMSHPVVLREKPKPKPIKGTSEMSYKDFERYVEING